MALKVKDYYFTTKDVLGLGFSSRVYRGYSLNDPKISVAMKVLHDVKDFPEETGVLLGLSEVRHPNILQLIDHQNIERKFYLIYEYCNGGTLKSYLEGRVLSLSTIKLFARQIVRARYVLHIHGIANTDFWPGNILLSGNISDPESIVLKISGFGQARYLRESDPKELRNLEEFRDFFSIGMTLLDCARGTGIDEMYIMTENSFAPTAYSEDLRESYWLMYLLRGLLETENKKRFTMYELLNNPHVGLRPFNPASLMICSEGNEVLKNYRKFLRWKRKFSASVSNPSICTSTIDT